MFKVLPVPFSCGLDGRGPLFPQPFTSQICTSRSGFPLHTAPRHERNRSRVHKGLTKNGH